MEDRFEAELFVEYFNPYYKESGSKYLDDVKVGVDDFGEIVNIYIGDRRVWSKFDDEIE